MEHSPKVPRLITCDTYQSRAMCVTPCVTAKRQGSPYHPCVKGPIFPRSPGRKIA